MLKKILIGFAALVFALVVLIMTRPSTFHVERAIDIAAPSDAVFAKVNDFHQWEAWSPWEKLDPKMEKVFSGTPVGQGMAYAWSGNDKVGQGKMTITESKLNQLIRIRLEFLKPWKATNEAKFTFQSVGKSTHVVWGMDGSHNFMSKAFSMVSDLDAMIGKDFEKGLASLKATAEATPTNPL